MDVLLCHQCYGKTNFGALNLVLGPKPQCFKIWSCKEEENKVKTKSFELETIKNKAPDMANKYVTPLMF